MSQSSNFRRFRIEKEETHVSGDKGCRGCDSPWNMHFPLKCPLCSDGLIHCEEFLDEIELDEYDMWIVNERHILYCDNCGRRTETQNEFYNTILVKFKQDANYVYYTTEGDDLFYNREDSIIARLGVDLDE